MDVDHGAKALAKRQSFTGRCFGEDDKDQTGNPPCPDIASLTGEAIKGYLGVGSQCHLTLKMTLCSEHSVHDEIG